MIDLAGKQLSEAIYLLGREIQLGTWRLDRGGVDCFMVEEVQVQAVVTARPGSLIVESMTVSNSGQSVQQANQESEQKQDGKVNSAQGGSNTNTQDNTYKEL